MVMRTKLSKEDLISLVAAALSEVRAAQRLLDDCTTALHSTDSGRRKLAMSRCLAAWIARGRA